MSQTATVPSLMMTTSIVSEESLARDTHTHTHTDEIERLRSTLQFEKQKHCQDSEKKWVVNRHRKPSMLLTFYMLSVEVLGQCFWKIWLQYWFLSMFLVKTGKNKEYKGKNANQNPTQGVPTKNPYMCTLKLIRDEEM